MGAQQTTRWTRVGAVAAAVLALVAVGPSPVEGRGAPSVQGVPACTITWTGATGDGLWSTIGNWRPEGGEARIPEAQDVVCQGSDPSLPDVEIADPVRVREVRWYAGPSTISIGSSLTVDGEAWLGDVELSPGASLVTGGAYWDSLHVLPGAGPATVIEGPGNLSRLLLAVDHPLRLRGDTQLAGQTRVGPGGSIVLGGGEKPRPSLFVVGAVDLDGVGSLTNEGPINFFVFEQATIAGARPTLTDAHVQLFAPVHVEVSDRSEVSTISPGSTLTVRPSGSEVDIDTRNLDEVGGTLVLAGRPDAPVRLEASGNLVNDGIIVAQHAQLRAMLRNRGVALFGDGTRLRLTTAFATDHRNTGAIGIVPTNGSGTVRVWGDLWNEGRITSGGPGAELVPESALFAGGTVDVPVRPEGVIFAPSGVQASVRAIDLRDDGYVGVAIGGLTSDRAGTVRTSTPTQIGERSGVSALRVDGYHPCAGDRHPILVTPTLVGADPDELETSPVVVGDGTVSLEIQARPWGYVHVARRVQGEPSSGCRFALGPRAVALVHAEGLGRLPTTAEVDRWKDGARSELGQELIARLVLRSPEARRFEVAASYARIVARPVDPGGSDFWTGRLVAGQSPLALRAELYGSSSFWARAGGTDEGFADLLYRTELGRGIDPGGRAWVQQRLAAGSTRTQIARTLLATAEARRAFADRAISQWWARPASADERRVWGDRFGDASAEDVVMARLVAATPGT